MYAWGLEKTCRSLDGVAAVFSFSFKAFCKTQIYEELYKNSSMFTFFFFLPPPDLFVECMGVRNPKIFPPVVVCCCCCCCLSEPRLCFFLPIYIFSVPTEAFLTSFFFFFVTMEAVFFFCCCCFFVQTEAAFFFFLSKPRQFPVHPGRPQVSLICQPTHCTRFTHA